jgi:enoyl-[acyl-carrier protein] reductase I
MIESSYAGLRGIVLGVANDHSIAAAVVRALHASGARLAVPHMPAGGSLVTMTYHGAEEVVPHYGLMGPVKAALESMVRYLAAELGPKNIRVHAVSPGPVPTRAASGIEDFEALMREVAHKSPLRRLVTTEEIAQLTRFLSGPESSGMTGQTIYVDGGYFMMA